MTTKPTIREADGREDPVRPGAKLLKAPLVVQNLGAAGVPLASFPRLAPLEILGAIGLIVGLFAPPVGVAAAIGVLCYFAGALSFHVRAGDRSLAPPLVFFVLAVVALITRLGS